MEEAEGRIPGEPPRPTLQGSRATGVTGCRGGKALNDFTGAQAAVGSAHSVTHWLWEGPLGGTLGSWQPLLVPPQRGDHQQVQNPDHTSVPGDLSPS